MRTYGGLGSGLYRSDNGGDTCAQAGYAISSAIATALVAAGAYVDIDDRSLVAQVLAGVARRGS